MQIELIVPVVTRIGVSEAERSMPQKLQVCLLFSLDAERAAEKDDLTATLDYQQLYDYVQRWAKDQSVALLERFAFQLKAALIKEFPEIKSLSLVVEKYPFPAGGKVRLKV